MEPARYLHDPDPWDDLWADGDDPWPADGRPDGPEASEGDEAVEEDRPEPDPRLHQLSFEDLPEGLRGMYHLG